MRFDFIALCDSGGYVHQQPISDASLPSLLRWKAERRPFYSFSPGGCLSTSASAVVQLHCDRDTVVVDCAATPHTIDALLLALRRGAGIALANKQPLCTAMPNFTACISPQHRHRFRYESTVGAGTPFITTLQRLLASNDAPHRLQGTFSGTLGFLCSGLAAGRQYSDVVAEAVSLGYTEPEPRDDLGGVDVGRKALILARTLGWQLEMSDVEIQPLYPPSLAALSVPDFLAALPSLNAEYAARHQQAQQDGRVLRYVATLVDGRCTVGLQPVPADSPLGRLSGTANLLEYYSGVYKEQPLVVQGSGAGGEVTASGVLADMIELAFAIGKEIEVQE